MSSISESLVLSGLFGFLATWWSSPSVLDSELFVNGTNSLQIIPFYAAQAMSLFQYVAVVVVLFLLLRPTPIPPAEELRNIEEKVKNVNFRRVDLEKVCKELKPSHEDHQYLVVGAGFLGNKLIQNLLLRGEKKIRVMDMNPNAVKAFAGRSEIEFIQGDVTKKEQVEAVMKGVQTVYCTFAIIRFMDYLPHEAKLSEVINVTGTRNVVEAAQAAGVKHFIQTSSSNVSVGSDAQMGMTEKHPYVNRQNSPNHYGWSKAESEQIVLEADGKFGMRTAVIRPCSGIFGAQDNYMLDDLLKSGTMVLPHTAGLATIDFISAENVVHGHLLLEKKMKDGSKEEAEAVCGEAFCISNEDPLRMYEFVKTAAALRPGGVNLIRTPRLLLIGLSKVVDLINRFAPQYNRKLGKDLSKLTPATINYLTLSYSFKSTKAKKLLGYEPLYTVEEGIAKAVQEYIEGRMLPALKA